MIKSILLTTLLVFSASAFAQTTHQVMGKAHYQGEHVVRLKKLTNQKLMALGENPDRFQLTGVTIMAKSRHGKGKATLIVGQDQQTKKVANFGAGDFSDLLFELEGNKLYHKMHWNISNAPGLSNERWQLRLNGNIKVRRIHVHLTSAAKKIRIPMDDTVFAGDSTIYLRQELEAMGYRLKNRKLRKVVLVAKSRKGRGMAQLMIGQNFKPQKNVGLAQNGLGFQSVRPRSYNKIQWRANGPTRGAWQIHMNGRIRVKAVVVELQ